MNARIGLARAQLLRRVAGRVRVALATRDPLHIELPTYTEARIESTEDEAVAR
jgi:hypothetical protein